jgi:hypothetical protein
LLEQGVQVASGETPSPIAIVYSSNSGTLTGAVTNKDDLPAPGALVVLVPDSAPIKNPSNTRLRQPSRYRSFEVKLLR